ncbi:MAG: DUF5615 family PIN-like protein [Planctomycetes bacterium]|nr:DUF5615 family PIN-like protein [Planctomycetota bacterium]
MLRLLANENVPAPVVVELGRRGHDVAWIVETQFGAADPRVLDRSCTEDRLLLTFDKDFGDLVYRSNLRAPRGVILVRVAGASPEIDNQRLVEALDSGREWEGCFSIIEDDRIRARGLPQTKPDGDPRGI